MKNTKRVPSGRARPATKRTAKKRAGQRRRPLHRRLFLHPVTVLLLLCVGVLLAGITFHSSADSYSVTAEVPAAAPTQPAVITSPANQTRFTSRPITVQGTCPENTYVNLYRNGVFSGNAICGSGQTTFEIQTDLSLGSNVLLTQVFNITDQAGPPSTPITVYFDNPPSPASPAANQAPTQSAGGNPLILPRAINSAAPPFIITASFHYLSHVSGQPFDLQLGLNGGTGPYAVTIAWGDGTQSTVARKDGSDFTVEHTYNLSKTNEQTYLVRVEAVDSNNSVAFLQMAELVRAKPSSVGLPLIGGIGSNTPPTSLFKQWLWLIWPAYGVALLMVFSFWLGERQEYYNLFFRRKTTRRGHA